jgi:hypothetical protein
MSVCRDWVTENHGYGWKKEWDLLHPDYLIQFVAPTLCECFIGHIRSRHAAELNLNLVLG